MGNHRVSLTSHDLYFMPENKHSTHVTTAFFFFFKERAQTFLLPAVHLPVFYNIYTQLLIQCCTRSHHTGFVYRSGYTGHRCKTMASGWKHRHRGTFSGHYRPLTSQFYSFLTIRSMLHVLKCSRNAQMIEVQMWTINPPFTLSYL